MITYNYLTINNFEKSANIIFKSTLAHPNYKNSTISMREKKHYSAKGHLLCTSWRVSHTNLTYILGWVHIINHKQQWLLSEVIVWCVVHENHVISKSVHGYRSLANIYYLAKMWRMQIATMINAVSFPKI